MQCKKKLDVFLSIKVLYSFFMIEYRWLRVTYSKIKSSTNHIPHSRQIVYKHHHHHQDQPFKITEKS